MVTEGRTLCEALKGHAKARTIKLICPPASFADPVISLIFTRTAITEVLTA